MNRIRELPLSQTNAISFFPGSIIITPMPAWRLLHGSHVLDLNQMNILQVILQLHVLCCIVANITSVFNVSETFNKTARNVNYLFRIK